MTDMIGVKGNTYAEQMVDLMHQLGYENVTLKTFEGLSDIQIEQKARRIRSPRWKWEGSAKDRR